MFIGKFCIVRTYSAGVHFGTVEELCGTVAVLSTARRLWEWAGANTLHEVSTDGPSVQGTKISKPVPLIYLPEAIEVIPCSTKARNILENGKW